MAFIGYLAMDSLDPTLDLAPVAQIIFPEKITITFRELVELGSLGHIPKRLQRVVFEAPRASQRNTSVFEDSDNEWNDIVLRDLLPPVASSRKRRRPKTDEGSRKKRAITKRL
jgi:hypothetical protein